MKSQGKTVRRKPVFPCAHFPEKIAYLWNEICWAPYVEHGAGADRVMRMTPTMVGHLRQRYLSAQVRVHGTSRTITTLEDWAGFFHFISTSKFLMGEAPPKKGSPTPWRISLKWLLSSEENFTKVRNSKYHQGPTQLRLPLGTPEIPQFDEEMLKGYSPDLENQPASQGEEQAEEEAEGMFAHAPE